MSIEQLNADLHVADGLARDAYLDFKAANRAAWKIYHELTDAYAWGDETAALDADYQAATADREAKLQAYRDANALYREMRNKHAYL